MQQTIINKTNNEPAGKKTIKKNKKKNKNENTKTKEEVKKTPSLLGRWASRWQKEKEGGGRGRKWNMGRRQWSVGDEETGRRRRRK